MHQRVKKHKDQRADKFITIEEPLYLTQALQNKKGTVLVECVSMWINNMLYHEKSELDMFQELENLCSLDADIVFVINDVSCSVVSESKLVREFVDTNGRISQLLASKARNVFHTVAGISVKIK